jgi:hypothetical protein
MHEFRGAEYFQADDGRHFVNIYIRQDGEDFVRRITFADDLSLREAVQLKRVLNRLGTRIVLNGCG